MSCDYSLQVDLSEHVSNRGGGGETGAIIARVVCGIGAIILVALSPTFNCFCEKPKKILSPLSQKK